MSQSQHKEFQMFHNTYWNFEALRGYYEMCNELKTDCFPL